MCFFNRRCLANLPWRSEAGAALIEMALVTPLLLVLALGVGDFGRVMYATIVLSHAARAGAQYGSQSNSKATDLAGIMDAARVEAQNIGTIGVTAQLVCECLTATAVSCTTTTCGAYGAPRVFTEVTTTFTFQTLLAYPGIPTPVPLTKLAKMRVQ